MRRSSVTSFGPVAGGDVLVRSLVLRRLLRRQTLAPDEQYVGVLLPPTAAGAAVNLALAFDRRIAVNLNYTLTAEILNGCLAQAGICHVLTSRAFLEKVPLRLDTEYVYLEDFREAPTTRDKLIGAALALGITVAYHVNPLEARQIGRLCRERQGTILLAAPMFLRTYVQRCAPEDFASLEVVITGGERLPHAVASAFEEQFGLTPVEGYGTTETSPLIAANIPPAGRRSIRAWRIVKERSANRFPMYACA